MASKTSKTMKPAPKVTGDIAKAAADTVVAAATAPTAATKSAIEAVKRAPTKPVPAAIAAPAKAAQTVAKQAVDAAAPVVEAAAEAAAIVTQPIQQAVETAVTAAPQVAPTVEKDVTKMATQFETPKMFNDAGERAQAMLAKSQTMVADMGEFGKGNVEAMVEAGKIAAKGLETLGQDAADYTRRSFEGMTAALKTMSSVKSPTEFFKLQSEFVRSAFDQAVAQSSKTTEAMIKLTSDAAQPLSNRFAVAVEKVKTAA
ncbi:phasin family protein [Sphingomonas floccifaciens]|uniref:Phasin family protein n=1 Tax=Sphingomonas floccifaciens TaxID=1844115 RepID=A0ABW4N9P5_9SPHN